MTDAPDQAAAEAPDPAEQIAEMTTEMLDRITEAYCDANMKCDDDTGLYDVQPGCEARKAAAKVWLTVMGVGLLIDEVDHLRAEREQVSALAARLAVLVQAATPHTLADGEYMVLWRMAEANLKQASGDIDALTADRDLWHQRADTALGLQDLFETMSARWKALARRYRTMLRVHLGRIHHAEAELQASREREKAWHRACLTSNGTTCKICLGTWTGDADWPELQDHQWWCPVGDLLAAPDRSDHQEAKRDA